MATAFDFALFRRSSVGFDRLFDLLENSAGGQAQDVYPSFDLVSVDENQFRINLAIAGFTREEIEITAHQNQLIVAGKKRDGGNAKYIHRGIVTRAFERRFGLADHIKVTDADLKDGLLSIELVREVPEAMKARKIEIGGGEQRQRMGATERSRPEAEHSGERRVTKELENA